MAGWEDISDDDSYSEEDLKEVEEKIELMEEKIRKKRQNGENVTQGDKAHLSLLRNRRQRILEEVRTEPPLDTDCPECGSELEQGELVVDAHRFHCSECSYTGFAFGKPTLPQYDPDLR
ncbi:MAG: hypothetical protein ABEJ36_04655 [Candidatus Nanosalina sp.]